MLKRSTRPGWSRQVALGVLALAAAQSALSAQELIYQEGFNDDGSKATPPRYTFVGRDVYEVPRIQSELGNFDQKGPLYWGHNFDTTYVGNPEIPARRMIFTWRPGTDPGAATENLLKLWDSSVNWLLNNKKNAKIAVFPNVASIGILADRLIAAGHTVVDDDATAVPDEQDVDADLMIHGTGATNASRFVLVPKPVIVMNNPDYDDMLVGSIGSAVTFAPGKATISAAGHPAAGGLTGTFDAFPVGGADQTFELTGSFLPVGATTVATVTRVVPPSISSLGDLDAVVAGTKQNEKATGTVADLDFSEASAGSWQIDNAIPGGYTGNWGLQVKGKLNVTAAGTYRFALGSDDGARLQIDVDKNGFTAADTVLEDAGPHAHQAVYGNVTFPAAGAYDYEVRSYNSSGGGSLEVSVALDPGTVPDDALDSGFWEVLSTAGNSFVKLQGDAAVTAYRAIGPNVEVQTPLVVLLNGPNDTPKGSFYDGGPFTGFEGKGFIGASGLNKWPYPDGLAYRSVTLKPVNVAGKPKVKITVALAATVVDFETSDIIQIYAYPNGASSTPILLADFAGVQNAIQPWLADKKENNVRRLTKQFADFTFDVPAGATDLIVQFRVATTWWTEIAALDNVRITSGDATAQPINITASRDGTNLKLTWTGGEAPFGVQGKLTLGDANWTDLATVTDRTASIPLTGATGFIRVQSKTTKSVKLFRAVLSGAAERPNPVTTTTATGLGWLALDGTTATYYLSYSGLSAPSTAAHVHSPADATAAAGVAFGLTGGAFGNTAGSFIGVATVNATQAADIAAGKGYFNIHTTANPGGEIRGQLLP